MTHKVPRRRRRKPRPVHFLVTRPDWRGATASYAICTPEIAVTGYTGLKLTELPLDVTCHACHEALERTWTKQGGKGGPA